MDDGEAGDFLDAMSPIGKISAPGPISRRLQLSGLIKMWLLLA